MAWLPDDSRLLSAGAEGAVYEWRLSDLRRTREHTVKARSHSHAHMAACLDASVQLVPVFAGGMHASLRAQQRCRMAVSSSWARDITGSARVP